MGRESRSRILEIDTIFPKIVKREDEIFRRVNKTISILLKRAIQVYRTERHAIKEYKIAWLL